MPHSPSLNILGTEGTPRLNAPGGSNYAMTADVAPLDIVGDIDLRIRIAPDALSGVGNRDLLSKWAGGGNFSYALVLDGIQRPILYWSVDGVNASSAGATAAVVFTSNTPIWIRATLDVTNPAVPGNGYRAQFFTSTDGISWSQLGTNVDGGAPTSIYAGLASVRLGGPGFVLGEYRGDIYRAQILNGINGTTVFDADFTQQALGSRGFIESTGKLVSLVGNAARIVDGTTYGTMPSTSVAAGWTVPDSAALDVSDLEITARLSLNDWTAATNQAIVAKWDNGTGSRSYIWFIAASGRPTINYDIGGVAQPALDSGAAYPFTDGQTYWVRVRRIAATGVWRFYWAADSETEPTVWTNVGGDRAGTAGVLNNSTALTTIGAFNDSAGGYMAQGRMYRAIIRNANTGGTKVLDADFTRQLQFASTFTEGSANLATVTTVGAARIERERNLEVVLRVAADDWTPAALSTLIAKDDGAARQYRLFLNTSGTLALVWYPTGASASATVATSSVGTGAADGSTLWVKVTLDVFATTTNVVTFYTAPDSLTEPLVWTQLGTAITTTGATSFAPSTAAVEVATYGIGTLAPATGKVYHAIIRNGINGPAVLDIDFTDAITTGAETYLPDTVTEVIPEAEQYLPNLGWGGTALNARFGSAVGADTNDPLLLTHTGTSYLYLPGVAGNYASTPDSAALDITSDIDLIAYLAADDWTPSAISTILAKEQTTTTRSYRLSLLTTGALRLMLSANGSTETTATSSLSVPATDGTAQWVRATWRQSDGRVQFFVGGSGSSPSWVQLGIDATIAIASINPSTSVLEIGSRILGTTEPLTGKLYRAQVVSGIGGTVVFDANFSTGITSGAQTTFTESSTNAATVTINRSTSGRKSVAVVQDVLLFGTDDYLEVPDSNLLDFGASDSFTVMTAVRQWATTADARFVVKADSGTGWLLSQFTSTQAYFQATTPGQFPTAFSAVNLGALLTVVGVRDVATDTVGVSVDGAALTIATDTTSGTLANAGVLRVGLQSGGTAIAAEFRGSAIWRRALTAAEVALVNTHYTTGPTAASTALMRQAVWWIDAGTRSVAQINRSTSGRKSVACARCTWLLGTDDFFEVPASNLFDFAQGQDYTLLVLHRGWWAQGTNDTLLATSSSTTASAAGWAMSNSSGDPWQAGGRHGDGSNGVTAVAPRRDVGALSATWLVRDCDNDTLTAFTGSTSGTPVTDTTTGTIGNTNVMRLGRLSTTGAEYLDAEVVAAVVWRRRLTAAERNAVLAYYGV